MINAIAVFCGSASGADSRFEEDARLLGKTLAQNNIRLIYGGAQIGLMGAVGDACLHAGGEVIGVIPNFLESKEIAHPSLTELIRVKSMHERKTRMFELCDAFVALPGGFGTLEELFEILTWAQLGLHHKPIALLNTSGYYDDLIRLADSMVSKGFVKTQSRKMLLVAHTTHEVLTTLKSYRGPDVNQWLTEKSL